MTFTALEVKASPISRSSQRTGDYNPVYVDGYGNTEVAIQVLTRRGFVNSVNIGPTACGPPLPQWNATSLTEAGRAALAAKACAPRKSEELIKDFDS